MFGVTERCRVATLRHGGAAKRRLGLGPLVSDEIGQNVTLTPP